jgi:hypothetical protein
MNPRETGLEWLANLNKEDQILYCKNRVNHRRAADKDNIATFLSEEFPDFKTFIDQGFVWRDTPEGHDYWDKICNS